MNKIIKNTAIMLITFNMFSVTVLAADSSPVFTKNAGNIPTIYNLDKTYQKDQGKTLEDYRKKINPRENTGLMGFVQNGIANASYSLALQKQKRIDLNNVGFTQLFNKKTPTTDVIVERVDGDGNPMVITKVTDYPTTVEHANQIKGDKFGGSTTVYDKYYDTVILENKFSPTRPPSLQQTLEANSKSEKTLGAELTKKDPLMKDYLDSKGLSYKLSTDKVIINTVNNLKAEQVVEKNEQMAKEQTGSDQRAVEDAMLSAYNANLALIKPVVKPNIPTTAAGLTKMDKYKTMTPTVKSYSFKLETPKLDKDAMMKDFTSGLNLEGNELMEKAVENFQGIKKP